MKAKRVLVPVSGGAMDDEAVSLACDLARSDKGRVWLLYVVQMDRSLPLDAEVSAKTARAEQVLQHMERIGKAHKCRMDGEVVQARDIGPAVVQEAVQRDVELIVVGLPYERQYGMPTLGSTVPYILKYAPCQVLVSRGRVNGGSAPAEEKH